MSARAAPSAAPTSETAPADIAAVREAASRAAVAARSLHIVSTATITATVHRAADLLVKNQETLLEANRVDLAAGKARGLSSGLLDRLLLGPARLAEMADQLRQLATSIPDADERLLRILPTGARVLERRVPVGVIGAIFEARPNVAIDLASQVLAARSAVLMRTGAAALHTSAALVDQALAPALIESGLPPDAVQLLRAPGHGVAEALLAQPDLIPVVVVRGSGLVTRHLAGIGAAAGVHVLAHAEGGGVLFVDAAADLHTAERLVRDSLDRLGVCNRLNLLLLHEALSADVVRRIYDLLAELGIRAQSAPLAHPLGHEWALEPGQEATVTVAQAPDAAAAARLAEDETSGLAATICTEDPAAAEAFFQNYFGTSVLWNWSTRLIDGYKLLGLPETGINVARTLGPRGPVTFTDLGMRQFVVRPPETPTHPPASPPRDYS